MDQEQDNESELNRIERLEKRVEHLENVIRGENQANTPEYNSAFTDISRRQNTSQNRPGIANVSVAESQ